MFDKYMKEWQKLIRLHNISKKYFILSEEFGKDLEMFIQPMKETRDAYEHIIRAYNCIINDNTMDEATKDKYVKDNMYKAIGHEYRAIFDVLDYLSISLRLKITDLIKGYTYKELVNKCPEYREISLRIIEISNEIADLRNKRELDVSIAIQ